MIKLQQPIKGKLIYAPDGIISQLFNDPNTNKALLTFYQSLGLKGHNGIDLVTFRGDNVYCAHDGKVVHASNDGNVGGNWTKICFEEDSRFWANVYGHQETILVKVGDNVSAGQIIGTEGNSGSSAAFYMGVHTHFGLYEYEDNTFNKVKNYDNGFQGGIDPLPYLTNMILKIIGDNKTKKQYLLGNDGFYTWIYDENLLNWIHNSGIADKTQVSWQDVDPTKIKETIALIK
jgi:murein DD-endopeptidase MepM/ murein hydrolase activator NlpD